MTNENTLNIKLAYNYTTHDFKANIYRGRFCLTLDVWLGFKEIKLHLIMGHCFEKRSIVKGLNPYKCLSVNAVLKFC